LSITNQLFIDNTKNLVEGRWQKTVTQSKN
jgi:hypothetical protein